MKTIKVIILGIIFLTGMMPLVFADVYINVMAVNGSPDKKDTSVKYNLPGDLKAEDILDTNGLKLDYNVADANYVVSGSVSLEPKESKTFRIRVKDIWHITPEQTTQIKSDIEKGFEQVGKIYDAAKAQELKDKLEKRLDFITQQQSSASSIEQRIDSYRSYRNEVARIRDEALAVDYWKSNPEQNKNQRIIHFNIDTENPVNGETKPIKEKQYLPSEVKPQDVVEAAGFEIRYDQERQQSFLFKEEEIPQGQKKSYTIGLRDIWHIEQNDIDYLRKRADYAEDFLKNSKYAQTAKVIYDQIDPLLKNIEESQKKTLEITEHISAYRDNHKSFEDAKSDVENIEKLLALYREELEKSKVENVLSKVRSLKGLSDFSKQVFDKKPTESKTWSFISWVLLFVGGLSIIYFIVLLIRSNSSKLSKNSEASDDKIKGKEGEKK